MGKTTDELMGSAAAMNDNPPARELDRLLSTGEQVSMTLLAMAIEARGYKAISFTGRQAGIETNGTHNKAQDREGAQRAHHGAPWTTGYIPVVAGFQGIDANGDITTLGRGGSDTTAVAVAWGIGADVCEIYSDVDGVYTTDPRVAPRARKLDSRSPTTTCWSFPAPAPACLQMRARWSSHANGKWSSIPARRSRTPKAPTSRRSTAMEEAVITGIAQRHLGNEGDHPPACPTSPDVAARVFAALAS